MVGRKHIVCGTDHGARHVDGNVVVGVVLQRHDVKAVKVVAQQEVKRGIKAVYMGLLASARLLLHLVWPPQSYPRFAGIASLAPLSSPSRGC